jgi:hypothetical protein
MRNRIGRTSFFLVWVWIFGGNLALAKSWELEPTSFGNRERVEWLDSKASRCWLRRTTVSTEDPVDGRSSVIVYDEYIPIRRDFASRPSVVILPPTGGETFIDRGYARSLCRRQVIGVIVKHWTHDTETGMDLETHDRGFARGIVAIRRVKHWIHAERADGKLGILGTSVGGLYAGLALSVDPDFSAGSLIVAGAPLATILARSTLPAVVKQREDRMLAFSIASQDEYEKLLMREIDLDMLQAGKLLSSRPMLMIRSSTDTVVPSSTQEVLWNAAGSPDGQVYSSNHKWSIVRAYLFQRTRVARFFAEVL